MIKKLKPFLLGSLFLLTTTDIKGAGFVSANNSLKAIRDKIDGLAPVLFTLPPTASCSAALTNQVRCSTTNMVMEYCDGTTWRGVNAILGANNANNANNGVSTNLVTANADGSIIERLEAMNGWHGCYRATCEVHTSCIPASFDSGETDKGTGCPRNGGLWNAQDNPTSYSGFNPGQWTTVSYIYGSKFNADYYVTCEQWCYK